MVEAYLETLFRQMAIVRQNVPQARFKQLAIGGGTPTYLSASQLERSLSSLEAIFETPLHSLPTSVETSPATATPERLRVLSDFGVERISLGIQSFDEEETRLIGRPQRADITHDAIDVIRQYDFAVLNVDLIYGDPRQSRESWLASLVGALRHQPEELYLYPLYVRPGTGLARTGRGAANHRRDLYRTAREMLLERGYLQTSLRSFRLPRTETPSAYACQRDGMIGLGCGARSYTRRLHYATRFAVTQAGVRAILQEWVKQSDDDLAFATHGIRLSDDEQRRRYAIMSLLQAEGMLIRDYVALFGTSPNEDLTELDGLVHRGWLVEMEGRLVLTSEGLERSDEVGPMLFSESVRRLLKEFIQL